MIVCAAGWAFKFVPIIGDILASLALEVESKYDISGCSITRPKILKQQKHAENKLMAVASKSLPQNHVKISAKAARGIQLKE